MVRLFWFGDDWALLSEYADLGLVPSMLQPFAENFAPLFKLVWVAAVTGFRGSYLALLLLLWASHVANIWLFGTLLRRSEFGSVALTAALLAFGLSWTNLESLAWSPQLSQLLSVTFFLLAWVTLIRAGEPRGQRLVDRAIAMLFLLASGFFFARGVIGGVVLALYQVGGRLVWKRRTFSVGSLTAVLGCSVVTFVATLHFAGGQMAQLGGVSPRSAIIMTLYAISYLVLNPLLLLLRLPWQDMGVSTLTSAVGSGSTSTIAATVIILAVVSMSVALAKLAIVAFALATSSGRTRLLLVTLIAFDIGNALILALGRSDLGLGTAVSSRYQYVSWLGFAPCLGIAFQSAAWRVAKRLTFVKRSLQLTTAVGLVALVALVALPWPLEASRWADWRGTAIRQEVRSKPSNEQVSFVVVTAGRARELEREFGLH
jgi:hypothetical protein